MAQRSELDRLTVFATDFAHLYTRFVQHFPDSETVTIEGFGELFDASRVEYLHYTGGTALDKPFFPAITDDLLQLSSAYLSLPHDVSQRGVRTFGLLLALFLYSTQPARPLLKSSSSEATAGTDNVHDTSASHRAVDSAEEACSGVGEAAAPPLPPPLHSSTLPLRPVPISVSCLRHLLLCLSNGDTEPSEGSLSASATPPSTAESRLVPLTYTEAKALLLLHRAGGWLVEPYVREGNHVTALLTAHATCGVPLLRPEEASQQPPLLPPEAFTASLTARAVVHAASPSAAVGGRDSLLRDPAFVQMQQDYIAARQQLLQP